MRVAVLIPTRGDRPGFMENCLRMIAAQTVKPVHIQVMDYAPESGQCDITQRYKRGYHKLCGKGYDVIAFMENDDWYHPEYLEVMLNEWEKRGRPDLFGTQYTIYYHLKIAGYFTMYHQDRASAMNTLIKPDLELLTIGNRWPMDHEAFTDMWLWHRSGLHGVVVDPGRIISVGMKHGIGMCGGRSHVDKLYRYSNHNDGFLERTLDPESYKFYRTFYEPIFNKSATPEQRQTTEKL